MRRFLIWSGLAVVIGLVLAVGGYLAYDQVFARFQPVTLMRNQGQIQRLLDESSWVSPGGGDGVLYIIGYRDSDATRGFERQEAERFRNAGIDVRIITFARTEQSGEPGSTPTERTTLAELWLNRDWDLYERWISQPASDWQAEGLAPADGNLARTAIVEGSRRFAGTLDGLMRDAGVKPTWPLVIWRDRQGFLKACACADSRSWKAVRDDIFTVDTVPLAPRQAPAPVPAPPAAPEVPTYEGLPYPDPVIAPPIRPQAGPQTTPLPPQAQALSQPQPQAQARPAPSSVTPPRPVQPRAAQPAPPAGGARPPAPRPARPANRPTVEQDTMFY